MDQWKSQWECIVRINEFPSKSIRFLHPLTPVVVAIVNVKLILNELEEKFKNTGITGCFIWNFVISNDCGT